MLDGSVLDELMANAWPARVEETHRGWRYRWTDGVTRRANSVLAVGSADAVDELVDRAEVFYGTRGAPVLVQASTASAPVGLADRLAARGYRSTARTLVETATSRSVAARTGPGFDVALTDEPTDEWFATYWSVESGRGQADADAALCRKVLLAPEAPAVFAAARDGDRVVGVGQIVIERGWAGLQCMATASDHRRRGVADVVLHALASEADQRGIARMYLAVMADNDGAAALYRRAGFAVTHEYRYFAGGAR